MPKRKRVFTKSKVDSKRRKVTRQNETEEQREKRLSNIRTGMRRIRGNQTEEQRARTNEETRSRVKSIRNRQSADQREVEKRKSKAKMATLRQQRTATRESLELQAFHYDCKKNTVNTQILSSEKWIRYASIVMHGNLREKLLVCAAQVVKSIYQH